MIIKLKYIYLFNENKNLYIIDYPFITGDKYIISLEE